MSKSDLLLCEVQGQVS